MYLYPNPYRAAAKEGEYVFGRNAVLTVDKHYVKLPFLKLFKELWKNFTAGLGELEVKEGAAGAYLCAKGKDCAEQELFSALDGFEYRIRCGGDGIRLGFDCERGLIHALGTVLRIIETRCTSEGKESFAVPYCEIDDKPEISFRGLHLIIHSKANLNFLHRQIRLAGLLGYSHIVIESFGMVKLDTLKELSWKRGFTKEQLKPLIDDAHAFGMQVIPGFNHWGHASLSGIGRGAHVVLDQNPALAPLFETDGWTWNLKNPDTLELLRKVRAELSDFMGPADYFHICCDESSSYGTSHLYFGCDKYRYFTDYLNGIAAEQAKKGRQIIVWGDMFLQHSKWEPDYLANGPDEKIILEMFKNMDKSIIINDWQYDAMDGKMATSKFFADNGFEVILSPWKNYNNFPLVTESAKSLKLKGLLLTTWGDTETHARDIPLMSEYMWRGAVEIGRKDRECMLSCMAAYIRKLLPPTDESEAGWMNI